MSGVPFFIDTEDAAGPDSIQICGRIRMGLLKSGIAPLPLASTLEEFKAVLKGLQQAGQHPAIYIVNTFGAKELIGPLDQLMGDTPVMFFRRTLFAGQSGFMEKMSIDSGTSTTVNMIEKMAVRLTSVWFYGSKNSDRVAQLAATAVSRFLEDGEFRHIELANVTQGR